MADRTFRNIPRIALIAYRNDPDYVVLLVYILYIYRRFAEAPAGAGRARAHTGREYAVSTVSSGAPRAAALLCGCRLRCGSPRFPAKTARNTRYTVQ
jgi:hypothetical protein